MQPISLVFKNLRVNSFTGRDNGELMIVHKCMSCGRISPNRIAGDDDEYQILLTLKESINLNKEMTIQLKNLGLKLITASNKEAAFITLFGINYENYLKKFNLSFK